MKVQNSESALEPHERLKFLLKIRKEKIEAIHKLQKKRSLLMIDTREPQQQETQQDNPRKRVKVQSAIPKEQQEPQNQVCFQNQQDKLKQKPSNHSHKDTKQRKHKQPEKPEFNKIKNQFMTRNKRMFGDLNSYLKKAKSNIEAQKPKIEEKNRILEQVKQKQKEQSEQLLKRELYKLEIQLKQHEQAKEQNARQILKIENSMLLSNYKNYTNNLKPFIFTKTEPAIAWLPSKQSDIAKKLLGETQKDFQKESQKIEQSIMNYEQKFDYNTYLLENEKEYYINFAKKYYEELSHSFFCTEQQPHIKWKPNREMVNQDQHFKSSKKTDEKTISNLTKKSDSFYSKILQKIHMRTMKFEIDNVNNKQLLEKMRASKEEESESNSPYNFIKMDESD